MASQSEQQQANDPTDSFNSPGAVVANPGNVSQADYLPLEDQMVVKQGAGPLEWNGVGAFADGASVSKTHPGFQQWKDEGVLEPAPDVFAEPKPSKTKNR